MGADERRIKNEIANKQAIVDQLEQSKQAGLRREAERQAQEIKNLQAELQSRKPQK